MLAIKLIVLCVMVWSSSAIFNFTKCLYPLPLFMQNCVLNQKGKIELANNKSIVFPKEYLFDYFTNSKACYAYEVVPCDGQESNRFFFYNSAEPAVVSTNSQNETALTVYQQETLALYEKTNMELKREKKFLSDYMVSIWDTRKIDEDAENAKPIKDRMQDYIRYSVARLGLHELVDAVKLKPNFGTVYNDVLSFKYPLNIQACPDNGPSSLPSLFVAVSGVASDNNQKRRDEIRSSIQREIAQHQNILFSSINYGFFLGKPGDPGIQNSIKQESEKNKDVVQVDMIDNGRNGSLKLAAILNWVRLNCKNVDVIFKIDENFSKFSLKKLGNALSEMDSLQNNIVGVRGDTTPHRGNERRKISKEEFPWPNFPANINGLAYYFTGKMVTPLMAAFQTTPMISLEDVYLGICIIKSDMKRNTHCGIDINSNSCF